MTTRGQLPRLDAAPVSHTLDIPPDAGASIDDLAIPAAPAVVIFESAEGTTLLLATTADARGLVRSRLSGEQKPVSGSWRVDYRSLAKRLLVIRVGSALEADAVYLAQARERMPHAYTLAAERRRAWFAHVDPEAEFPEWTKTNLLGLVATRSAGTPKPTVRLDRGLLLGPLSDKDTAGRFLETVIDAFDLCRFHHLLVLSPGAAACAYKEMGRCPAPCDGSETMVSYRRRVAAAAEMLESGGVAGAIAEASAEMAFASARSEFERAAECKRRAERLKTLTKPAFSRVRRLDRWQELAVLPGAERGAVTLALFDRGRLYRVGEVAASDSAGINDAVARADHVLDACANSPPIDQDRIATIGLMSRWMTRAKTRRRGETVGRTGGRFDPALVAKTARIVGGSRRSDTEIEPSEIEAG